MQNPGTPPPAASPSARSIVGGRDPGPGLIARLLGGAHNGVAKERRVVGVRRWAGGVWRLCWKFVCTGTVLPGPRTIDSSVLDAVDRVWVGYT